MRIQARGAKMVHFVRFPGPLAQNDLSAAACRGSGTVRGPDRFLSSAGTYQRIAGGRLTPEPTKPTEGQ